MKNNFNSHENCPNKKRYVNEIYVFEIIQGSQKRKFAVPNFVSILLDLSIPS